MAQDNPTSRRRFLGGSAVAAAGLVLGSSVLAACGSEKSAGNPESGNTVPEKEMPEKGISDKGLPEKAPRPMLVCTCAAGHRTTYDEFSAEWPSGPSTCDATDQYTGKRCGRTVHCVKDTYDPG